MVVVTIKFDGIWWWLSHSYDCEYI